MTSLLPWRTGRTIARNLYRNDVYVGVVDTPELAAEIVAAMNGQRPNKESQRCTYVDGSDRCRLPAGHPLTGWYDGHEFEQRSANPLTDRSAEGAFRMIETWCDANGDSCGICSSHVRNGEHGQVWVEELEGNIECPVGVLRAEMVRLEVTPVQTRTVGSIAEPVQGPTCTRCDEEFATLCGTCHRQSLEEAVDHFGSDDGRQHCRGCVTSPGALACAGVPPSETPASSAWDPTPTESELKFEIAQLRVQLGDLREVCITVLDEEHLLGRNIGTVLQRAVDACSCLEKDRSR